MDLNKILNVINNKSAPKNTNEVDELPLYRGPRELNICEGEGCSKIATKEAANLYGLGYNSMNPQDAWYKRAAVLKSGGKEVWNKSSKGMKGLKVGDFISLDRGVSGKELYGSNVKGYNLKDNEGNEHLGVIIGRDEKGRILVKHGSESGKVYIQPIDELNLPEYGFKYKPTSIYRSKAIEDKKIVNTKNYESQVQYSGVDRNKFSPSYVPTENEKNFVDALNKNAQSQQNTLSLNPKEAKMLRDISFGIFQNESEGGDTKTPIGLKMFGSQLAHAFGRDASPSLGDIQFKYDDIRQNKDKTLTAIGRRMDELNVQKSGMSNYLKHRDNYNDEANAVMALISSNYDKIKKDPSKYQYNPKDNTVYGGIPLEQALLSSYNKPGYINSKEKLLSKEKYAKNALTKMSKLDENYRAKGNKASVPTVKEIMNIPYKSGGNMASKLIDLGIL